MTKTAYNTIARSEDGWFKMADTVRNTVKSFGGVATPEEVYWAISNQLSSEQMELGNVTLKAVRRSMQYACIRRSPGSNSYTYR